MYMELNVVYNINHIKKTFTKPNCSLCMEERLAILKNKCNINVTLMNKKKDIYGQCSHKSNLHQINLNTDYTSIK